MSGPGRYARLASRALIRVAGPEAKSFLHGLLTQDVETLADGQMRFAALLTPQGRLIFDLFLIGEAGEVLLDVAAEHREDLLRRLTIYRLRAKVTLSTDERPVVALWDAAAAPPGWTPDPRLPQLGWRGVDLPAGGSAVADEAAYEQHRLDQGAPGPADWGVERSYPIEADFDLLNGIDFQKGCFVGQETTSRMKRRGQIKTRMLPLVFDGPSPPPGTEVLAGELRAGVVGAGAEGRAMATLRLDRIAGVLTVDGRPARVRYPDWYPREFA
jgi:folate-binding protein YgfZ